MKTHTLSSGVRFDILEVPFPLGRPLIQKVSKNFETLDFGKAKELEKIIQKSLGTLFSSESISKCVDDIIKSCTTYNSEKIDEAFFNSEQFSNDYFEIFCLVLIHVANIFFSQTPQALKNITQHLETLLPQES